MGSSAWQNPQNATAADGASTRSSLNRATSNYLRCTGYGYSLPAGVTINGISVSATYSAEKSGQTTYMSTMKSGSLAGSTKTSNTNWPSTLQTTNFGGATDLWGAGWSTADINSSGFGVSMYVTSNAKGNTGHYVDSLSITVTYSYNPVFTQSAYQWFTNTDSVSVGPGLNGVSQNTPTFSAVGSDTFRLRMLVRVDGDVAPAGLMFFKLQYAVRGSDNNCDPSFVGESYYDVTTTSPIAYADNPTPTDGQTITSSSSPTDGSRSIILQEYNEQNNTGVATSIFGGQVGMWDFALRDRADSYGAVYCMRMVNSSGATFPSYLQIPQISTAAGIVSVNFVDNGTPVLNPSFAFPLLPFSHSCQSSELSLDTGSSRLRVSQLGNAGAGWNVSMAPTGGDTALWSNGDSSHHYDFNDDSGSPPGCLSGSDGDTYAGQLSLNLSTASFVPVPSCSTSGISIGPVMSSYTPTLGSLTVFSANSTAQRNCYFELAGVRLRQTIPPSQAPGNYSINMTVTVTSS